MIHNCCAWFHCHLLHGTTVETKQLSQNRVTTEFVAHLFLRHPRQRLEKLTVYEHATLWHPFLFCRLRPHRVDMKLFHELIRPALVKNCLICFCWGTGGATLSLTQLGYPSAPPVELELFLVLQASVECSTLWLWASLWALLKNIAWSNNLERLVLF